MDIGQPMRYAVYARYASDLQRHDTLNRRPDPSFPVQDGQRLAALGVTGR